MKGKELELYINGDCYCNAMKPSCKDFKSCTYTIAVVDEDYNIITEMQEGHIYKKVKGRWNQIK